MKIAVLHRYPEKDIKQTNASFPYFIEALRKEHTVDFITFKTFNRFKNKLLKSLIWIFYGPMRIWRHHYDLIYCDDSFPFYAGLVKILSPKSKVIKRLGDFQLMYYFSGFMFDVFHLLEKIEWRMVNKLILISEAMRDYMFEEDLGLWGKSLVVNDPIELEDFKYNPDQIKCYDVMFHGTLDFHKGIESILEAAWDLHELSFCILGDGVNRWELELLAPKNVHFIGWQDFRRVPFYLSLAKVGIAMRSNNRGNQYVITQAFLQYAAVGIPVLVSKRKTFEDYEWSFKGGELVEYIKTLIKSEDLRTAVSLKNRKLVEEKHDARKIGKQLADICSSALS